MSLKSYYRISMTMLKIWYNVIGIDSKSFGFDKIHDDDLEVHELNELSPFEYIKYLPSSSQEINEEMITFLERTCYLGSENFAESLYQKMYIDSYLNILNTVTLLNLIPDNSEDYALHFKRLNSIMLTVLQELNRMQVEEVISFFQTIISKSQEKILDWHKNYPKLVLLTLLATCPNPNTKDYTIFSDNESCTIDWNKLMELVKSNFSKRTKEKTEEKIDQYGFTGRLSYKQSLVLMRNSSK